MFIFRCGLSVVGERLHCPLTASNCCNLLPNKLSAGAALAGVEVRGEVARPPGN